MYITVSASAVAICISGDDMRALGLKEPVGAKAARELVRDALRENGETPWLDMELELFSCGEATLLMARPLSDEVHLFSFSSAERLIEAAAACRGFIPSSLFSWDGRFLLSLRCGGGKLPMPLFEYGEYKAASEALYTHLCEHSDCLIPFEAIDSLNELFGTN